MIQVIVANKYSFQMRAAHLSSQTALGTQRPRRPSMPAKRSNPLSFTPPKGSDWHMYVVAKSLIDVMPACNPAQQCSHLSPAHTLAGSSTLAI